MRGQKLTHKLLRNWSQLQYIAAGAQQSSSSGPVACDDAADSLGNNCPRNPLYWPRHRCTDVV